MHSLTAQTRTIKIKPNKIHALTAIRGFAALWVCAYHGLPVFEVQLPALAGNFVRSGWLAVDLFFILSGFVISFAHMKDFETPGFAWTFLKLRLARIYPAHLVAALLWLPVAILAARHGMSAGMAENFNAGTFLHAVTLTNGWGLPNSEGWNLPSWSVGSEWFAYLLFPLLAPLLLGKSPRWYLLTALGVMAVTTGFAVAVYGFTKYMPPEWGVLLRVESEFLIGCCVYGIYRNGIRLPRALLWASVAGVAALAISGLHGLIDGLYVPLFALVILGLTTAGAPRGLVWLGKISYSLYLVHALVMVVMGKLGQGPLWLLAFLVASVFAGWTLYALVEEPARKAIRKRIATSTGSDDR